MSRDGARRAGVFAALALGVGAAAACDGLPSLGDELRAAVAAVEPTPPPSGSPVDSTLAEAGARLYRQKGCLACHQVGGNGAALGPDLRGVTRRRSYAWFQGMVTNPDSMFRADSAAAARVAAYVTPMRNQQVSPRQARAIFEYLRADVRRVEADSGGSGG